MTVKRRASATVKDRLTVRVARGTTTKSVIKDALTTGAGPREKLAVHLGHAELPRGWEVRRLKFVATCNDEALPETTDPDYEMAYVDISSVDLVDGISAVEHFTFEKAPSRARRIVRDGDTIVSTVRTYLKAIAPVDSPPGNMIVSTGFAVIRPTQSLDCRLSASILKCNTCREVMCCDGNELQTSEL